MKKTITILLAVFMVFSLFVSCNDGEEGLFQMAANSVKKESFKIYNIINKQTDNVYIVTTDNGVAKYNTETKSFSDFKGTGVMAANAIWASSDGSEFIYYDASSNSYKNQDGEDELLTYITGYTPQPFYCVNGEEFTYVFKDEEGNYYSHYSDHALQKTDFQNSLMDPIYDAVKIEGKTIKSVTIIGNGFLRVICTDNSIYLYDVASTDPKPYHAFDLIVQGFADDGLFITNYGDIYNYNTYEKDSQPDASTGLNISTRPSMYTIYDGLTPTYTYIIPDSSSSIIELKWNGTEISKSTKTVTGLQNITVIAIIGKVDNKLVVLTANNGVQELELK
ncbi:MAG: hypothetical protein MSS69_04805 [Spirochaetales bacterium]|nr:hypothetical protein [Spirochaetales bacterium]